MQPLFNISTFILLISAILCWVASFVLGLYSSRINHTNYWLSAYYGVIGYGLFVSFLLYSHFIILDPWFYTYRTGYIAAYLFMPFSFFYLRSLLQQKKFSGWDALHFLPVFIYIIDFLPYFLKPAAYKIQQAMIGTQSTDVLWKAFSEGWLGIGNFYIPFRIMIGTVYWILQIRIILQVTRAQYGQSLIRENREIIGWARLLCIVQSLFFIPYYLQAAFGPQELFFEMQHNSSAIGAAVTMIGLLLNPSILYGLKGKMVSITAIESENMATRSPLANPDRGTRPNDLPESDPERMGIRDPKGSGLGLKFPDISNHSGLKASSPIDLGIKTPKKLNYLSLDKLESINQAIKEHLDKNKTYLNKGYSIRHLATELNIQPWLVSAVINQVHQTNFNDYINKFRISHVKSLIESGQQKVFTLEALADQAGFSNRNSFTTAFKKHTNLTPSGFIKAVQNRSPAHHIPI